MKVLVPWSNQPTPVYKISWSRFGHEAIFHKGSTNLSVLEDESLTSVYEHEIKIIEPEIDNFILLPKEFDYGRTMVLMWRPLAKAGIWNDLMELQPQALTEFKLLREVNNY